VRELCRTGGDRQLVTGSFHWRSATAYVAARELVT